MRWHGTLVVAGAILAAVGLALPVRPPAHAAEVGTIKIATHSPLSGGQAPLGESIRNGARLAVEHLSGPLAKLGFAVRVVPFDDRAKPDVGRANASKIVADPDILLVIGHLNAGVALPSSEVYGAGNLAMISPANTDPRLTDRKLANVFRVVGRDDLQGVAGAEFARSLGFGTVHILHDGTGYGLSIAEVFRVHASKIGLTVVGFGGTSEKLNFDPVITPILTRKPDIVYFGGLYDQGGLFFKQARARGLGSAFMGPDGMDTSELVRTAGDAVAGMHYTAIVGPASVYPRTARFAEDYKRKFGEAPRPFAAQAYDATAIGLAAIERAVRAGGGGPPTRAQVAEEIRRTKGFKGLTGTFAFDAKGDAVPASYFVFRVVSGNPARWNDNVLVRRLEISP